MRIRCDARHERKERAVAVLEKRHPLLGAVRMTMDQMRSAAKDDVSRAQLRVRVIDIVYGEIDDRVSGRAAAFVMAQEEPDAAHIEQRDVAVVAEQRQAQHVAVPFDGLLEARYLA